MTAEQILALETRLVELFNDSVTSGKLPTPYSGIYTWGTALGTRRQLKSGQLVKILHPLTGRSGWGATRYQKWAGDVGMIVGKCDRNMVVGTWMVQFADETINPFPRDRIFAWEPTVYPGCTDMNPRTDTSAYLFLQGIPESPSTGGSAEDKAKHAAEIASYVDPFEVASRVSSESTWASCFLS